MNEPRIVGVIPARYASTRLPGKPLKSILGKTMIQRVYLRCRESEVLDEVCIATDDRRIAESVEAVGGRAIMTSQDHVSGTDRLAEAVESISADLVVNIQGDQPFIDPNMIREAVAPLLEDAAIDMGTLMHRITREEDLHDPAVVKVVTDLAGFALYFSRSTIPYPRNPQASAVFEHVGLYVYRREFLLRLAQLPPTPLEQTESLEQLRVLEHGHRICVVETQCLDNEFSGLSVDTPEDLARAEAMLRDRGGE
ncbi:MAG: 3-deoxy-manno-octulosonate cytidylyltransferase [Pirellulales bacterium]